MSPRWHICIFMMSLLCVWFWSTAQPVCLYTPAAYIHISTVLMRQNPNQAALIYMFYSFCCTGPHWQYMLTCVISKLLPCIARIPDFFLYFLCFCSHSTIWRWYHTSRLNTAVVIWSHGDKDRGSFMVSAAGGLVLLFPGFRVGSLSRK